MDRNAAERARQDALYADEPWAKLATEAGYRPWDTESAARRAFEYCADTIAALRAEVDGLREELRAFLPVWAVTYAKFLGLPDSHLHPQHFDRMAELGCRMDDFTRAEV
jgi:hypothetical protein